MKYENTVWTGFEHGRLKQNRQTSSKRRPNHYPTPLLNKYGGNKRTVDIKHKFYKIWIHFYKKNKNMPQWNKILGRQIFSNKLEERVYAKMILFQWGSFSESPGSPFIWTVKFREIAFSVI